MWDAIVDKKQLTETDIRSKFITPAIVQTAGWNLQTQILEERYLTKGRVIVRGKTIQRGEAKKADYVLYYKPNLPIAVVEAEDNRVNDLMALVDRLEADLAAARATGEKLMDAVVAELTTRQPAAEPAPCP